ncbi:hypothetical protein TgHK011_007756 [Trichoderma gracile]|nr:hypothetical protein TgHK011_007756 [Trichoderma gracile]
MQQPAIIATAAPSPSPPCKTPDQTPGRASEHKHEKQLGAYSTHDAIDWPPAPGLISRHSPKGNASKQRDEELQSWRKQKAKGAHLLLRACRGLPLGAASLAHDAVLLKPAPDFETRGSPHLFIYRGSTPAKQTAWGICCALGTGDWRFGIESRGQWRRAARSQPRPGDGAVANHRARGPRQPAAMRRIRGTKHEKLVQQANENEPRPRCFWMEQQFRSPRTEVHTSTAQAAVSRLVRVRLTP